MRYPNLPTLKTTDGKELSGFPVHIPNPSKLCTLRLPTNAESTDWLTKQKRVYTDLGRGKGRSEPVFNPQSNRALFDKIRIDNNGPEFDDYEVEHALESLMRHRVLSCVRDSGDTFRITIESAFDEVVHVVGMPTMKDLKTYQRSMYVPTELGHGRTERRFPPEPSIAFHDAIVRSIEGYADGLAPTSTPVTHKIAVTDAVQSALAEEFDARLDPN